MKFCPYCGTPLSGEKFCPKCGKQITEQNVDSSESKKSKPFSENSQPIPVKPKKSTNKKRVFLSLIVVVVSVACVGGYFGFQKYQEKKQEEERTAQTEEDRITKEKEQADKKAKEKALADKANVKQSAIASIDQGDYVKYVNLIGAPLTDAKDQFQFKVSDGRFEDSIVKDGKLDDQGLVEGFTLYLPYPFESQGLLGSIADFPHLSFNKDKSYFAEDEIVNTNGVKLKLYYVVDTSVLRVNKIYVQSESGDFDINSVLSQHSEAPSKVYSVDEAIQYVKDSLNAHGIITLYQYNNSIFALDHEERDTYIIHVFDDEGDHLSTVGWFAVSKYTLEVIDNMTFNTIDPGIDSAILVN